MSKKSYELTDDGHVMVRNENGAVIGTIPFPTTFCVTNAFSNFIDTYEAWRLRNGLSGNIANVFEITTSIADKAGRICRYVKHQERNDPKPDWPEGMTTEMAGVLVYLMILKNNYGVDLLEGMRIELEKAVDQHSDSNGSKGKSLAEVAEETRDPEISYDVPIIKIVSMMILNAYRDEADTIVLERSGKQFLVRLYKADELFSEEEIPLRLQQSISSRVLIMGNMKISEQRTAKQEGTIKCNILGKEVQVEVLSEPVENGPKITMKIFKDPRDDS